MLTNGEIVYRSSREELKIFDVKDGLGLVLADAVDEVKQACDWIAKNDGGRGAVRELIDLLIRSRTSKNSKKL